MYYLRYRFNLLSLPLVIMRVCREVICSILYPLPACSLGGNSGPACLGVMVMGLGHSMRYR